MSAHATRRFLRASSASARILRAYPCRLPFRIAKLSGCRFVWLLMFGVREIVIRGSRVSCVKKVGVEARRSETRKAQQA